MFAELPSYKGHLFSPKIYHTTLDAKQMPRSKSRSLWEGELEERFTSVVNIIGSHSSPTEILYHMNVVGISSKQVSSHLQKYRTKPTMDTAWSADDAFNETARSMKFSLCGSLSSDSKSSCSVPVTFMYIQK